jgi:hypothetical protein
MRALPLHAGGQSFAKVRRHFLDPIALPKDNPRFEKPPLTNNVNLILPLEVISPQAARLARKEGKLVFHAVGDTGGIHGDETQVSVAEAMESQFNNERSASNPTFFYHLGDVIYFNGQSRLYGPQFYDPYKYYPAPIFAIAGNHDGDSRVRRGDAPDDEPSLFGFMENFCSPQAHKINPYRPTMTQPYVYWTLLAPLVTIIGLYSNVEGTLDARGTYEQQKWLQDQLQAAPRDAFLIIAVHHPPYSLDSPHGGSPDVVSGLDHAIETTKIVPHAVLSGHVHSMQRFTRRWREREIPYIVDGRGGYANNRKALHKLQKDESGNYPQTPVKTHSELDNNLDLTLEYYDQVNPGFLRVTATADRLTIESFAVPFDKGFTGHPQDSVSVDRTGSLLKEHHRSHSAKRG